LGCSIAECFQRQGEQSFRDVEESVIERLSQESRAVVATGGGAVLRQANRIALRSRSLVIYLDAPPQELVRRLHGGKHRPLFDGVDPSAKLAELFDARDSLYREVAHLIIPTTGMTSARIASLIGVEWATQEASVSCATVGDRAHRTGDEIA
jgi:shikimate kinase